MTYPKRLIEADLPIQRISTHARREPLLFSAAPARLPTGAGQVNCLRFGGPLR